MIRGRLRLMRSEDGLTLIELLIASAMSIVLLAAASTMLVGAVRQQPQLSNRNENVQTARWVLERMTREIRNGIAVVPSQSSVSTLTFSAYVRHVSCGSSVVRAPEEPSIVCKVSYSCTSTSCTRSETTNSLESTGTPETIFTGLDSDKVFEYSPEIDGATFVGVTLRFPNPEGNAKLTISDGATLRGGDPFGV